jgi:hypothetical protein
VDLDHLDDLAGVSRQVQFVDHRRIAEVLERELIKCNPASASLGSISQRERRVGLDSAALSRGFSELLLISQARGRGLRRRIGLLARANPPTTWRLRRSFMAATRAHVDAM